MVANERREVFGAADATGNEVAHADRPSTQIIALQYGREAIRRSPVEPVPEQPNVARYQPGRIGVGVRHHGDRVAHVGREPPRCFDSCSFGDEPRCLLGACSCHAERGAFPGLDDTIEPATIGPEPPAQDGIVGDGW